MDAFGAVAAGIQIIKDARTYIDGVRCRTEEIESARSQVDSLNKSLSLIETELRSIDTIDPDTEVAVKESLDTVRGQLSSLAKLLMRLTGESTSSSGTLRARLKDKGKQLSYPFNRSNVQDLERRLAELNASLGTALQLLSLQVQITSGVTRDRSFVQLKQALTSQTEVHKHEITAGLARIQQTQVQHHQQQLIAFKQGYARLEAMLNEVKQGLPSNADTTVAMARLSTQPATFVAAATQLGVTNRDVYAATEQIVALDNRANTSRKQFPCACFRKRHQSRSQIRYGRLSFQSESIDDTYHEPGCSLSYLQQHSKSRRFSVSFRVGNYRNHMSTVLAVAVNFSSGGNNQWSLAPEIRALNRVDLYRSPAHLLLHALRLARMGKFSNPERAESLAAYTVEGLARLFREGKASPYDADYKTGKTLLHYICLQGKHLIHAVSTESSESFWTRLRLLGFRNDVTDDQGLTPWAESVRGHGFGNPKIHSPLAAGRDWILPSETDYMGLLSYQRTGWDWYSLGNGFEANTLGLSPLVQKLLRGLYLYPQLFDGEAVYDWGLFSSANIREPLDLAQSLGPICRAIISRSIEQVEMALRTGTSSFGEMFSEQHGIYALDIAALWFPELLLSQSGPQIQDFHLYPTRWPLLQSLVFSLHSTADIEPERVVLYQEALTAVLQSNLPIWWGLSLNDGLRFVLREVDLYYRPTYYFPHKPHKPQIWIQEIVEQMADRRRQLATFAINHLPLHEVRRLGLLHSMILDNRLPEVVETIESYGHTVPQDLIPFEKAAVAKEQHVTSAFHYTNYAIAEALHTAGFRINDLTLLLPYYSGSHLFWSFGNGLGLWLLARTDPATLLSDFERYGLGLWKWRMLHLLVAHASYVSGWEQIVHCASLLSELPGLFVCCDCCVCGCSSHGCTPFTVFLQGYSRRELGSTYCNDPAPQCAIWINQVNRNRPIPAHIAMQFARYWAFTTLECRHTCCNEAIHAYIASDDVMLPDTEERAEVQQEDEAKLAVLQHIMTLADECWRERTWSLVNFWRDFLKPLVDAELNRLETTEPLDDVLIGMQMVGVLQHTDSDEDEDEESLADSDVSEVDSLMYPDLSLDELEEERLLAAKRAIDRITGHQTSENGERTRKSRRW